METDISVLPATVKTPAAVLDAALEYAAAGIPIFPCYPANKRPYTQHGFKDASTDETAIRNWWTQWPGALIGMPTGAASGIDVLDIDFAKGGLTSLAALEAAHGWTRLDNAFQATPGGGIHYLFAHDPERPLACTAGKIAPGVDTRGGGGYIIVSPSVRADGRSYRTPAYGSLEKFIIDLKMFLEPAPDWLIEACGASRTPSIDGSARIGDPKYLAPGFAELGASEIDNDNLEMQPERTQRVVSALRALDCASMGYDEWLRTIHAFKAAVGGCEVCFAFLEKWCMAYPDNTPEIVREKWDSVTSSAIGWVWLRAQALKAGWTDPFPAPITEFDALPVTTAERAEDDRRAARAALPLIRVDDDDSFRLDQAEAALLSLGGVFSRGQILVRPTRATIFVAGRRSVTGTTLTQVTAAHLAELMSRAARFEVFKHGRWQPASPPADYAAMLLARREWKLPALAGIALAPTLRRDGSILDKPGYDEMSGLLFEPDGATFPPIPEAPTRDDAIAARDMLTGLLEGFPFASPADRAVALSAILTACIRRSLPTAPLHAFSAPVAGSGKTKLVDIAAVIAEGRPAEAINATESQAELDKRLDAKLLLGGSALFLIDNLNGTLRSDTLCTALTQPTISVRVLGQSTVVNVPSNAMFAATGNNLIIAGDLGRRTVLCRLDPRCERPELRTFDFDPVERAKERRGQYLAAALTILRAFHVAGRPHQAVPLGSFEQWSDWVRGALIWLDEADPCDTAEAIRSEDPERTTLQAVLEAWHAAVGSEPTTVKRLLEDHGEVGGEHMALREALALVCRDGGRFDAKKLGIWISNNRDRIVSGLEIVKAGTAMGGLVKWSVRQAKIN